jgi:uncharacterized glyoxalase superfamily protein PhnB
VSLSLLLRCEVIDCSQLSLSVMKFDALIIFTELDLWQQNFGMSGTIYIRVPDVDQYFLEVKDAVELAWTLQDMPYGTREFAVRDCNAYCLAFMQDDRER